jgi:myo-inositol-1(or 4)-monophosphatase
MNDSSRVSPMNETELLPQLERIVRRAGRMAMEFRPRLDVRTKADGSFVTQADIAIEEFLAGALGEILPEAAFLGEERPLPAADGERPVWIVDPIDGTDSYRQGLAYFGVSVGLVCGGDFRLGAFFNPHLDEMHLARRGGGATRNGEPVRVQTRDAITADCDVCGSSDFHRFFEFDLPLKVRSLGSTAQHLALVADGRSCFCFCHPRIWDVGATILLLQEAGGAVCHLDGSSFRPAAHLDGKMIRPPLVAGPANLLADILKNIAWKHT